MSHSAGDLLFAVKPGEGGLPKLVLTAADGARAEVYLYGAHVTSWAPAGGAERLHLGRRSAFQAGAPIRGGIPVIFPQFATTGPLPNHGLVRLMPWEFAGAEAAGEGAIATFRLRDTEESRRQWNRPFLAELTVAIGGPRLAVTLAITNTGAESFSFTAGLHTYLSVADLEASGVEGLAGLSYRDIPAGWVEAHQSDARIAFGGEVGRLYPDAPAEARLIEGDRTTVIRKAGFTDAVVWNPGAIKCPTFPDMEADEYRSFVCVEAATVGAPVSLAPGERWEGVQAIAA